MAACGSGESNSDGCRLPLNLFQGEHFLSGQRGHVGGVASIGLGQNLRTVKNDDIIEGVSRYDCKREIGSSGV